MPTDNSASLEKPEPPKCSTCGLYRHAYEHDKTIPGWRNTEYHEFVPAPSSSSEICQNCNQAYVCWFAPNEIWNLVIPDRVGMLCPNCFLNRAEHAAIDLGCWKLAPEFMPAESSPKPAESPQESIVVALARELYDRFVMGGWEPQDAYPLIRELLKPTPSPEPPRQTPCTLCMGSGIVRQEIREQLAPSSHSEPELVKFEKLYGPEPSGTNSHHASVVSARDFWKMKREVWLAALASTPQNEQE